MNRRELCTLLTVVSLGASRLSEAEDFNDATLEFAFDLFATLATPQLIGPVSSGERRIINITGGTVTGPMLTGVVVPGGADWQVVHANGVTDIHARYTLKADDGALLYVDAPGIREAKPEVIKRLNAGQSVDPAEYYFRTTPRIETSAEKYAWMNRRLFVCKGVRLPTAVQLRYYVVT